MRILLLGGTGEARRLAEALASRTDLEVTLSYAGRTPIARDQPLPMRIGGFGGAEGLRNYLRQHATDAVIDATHPFAARMSGNAAEACASEDVPLARLQRPGFTAAAGDDWNRVPDFASAARALGTVPKRVFLTIGQGGLEAFAAAPRHFYLVRSIEPPTGRLPPLMTLRLDRPPYTAASEEALMRSERIDVLVTKDSGGAATAGKLVAARRLGLPVVMIERPALPAGGETFQEPEAILDWIERRQAERGV